MAEHMTFNHGVRSSTLRWVTKKPTSEHCSGVGFFVIISRVELCEPKVRHNARYIRSKALYSIKTRV